MRSRLPGRPSPSGCRVSASSAFGFGRLRPATSWTSSSVSSLAPPSQQIGLGLGTPGVGLSCDLNVTVKATGTAAAQLASQVNPGRYCFEVYDLGTLTDAVSFTLLIEHPR